MDEKRVTEEENSSLFMTFLDSTKKDKTLPDKVPIELPKLNTKKAIKAEHDIHSLSFAI